MAAAAGAPVKLQRVRSAEEGFGAPAGGPLPVLEVAAPAPADPPGCPSAAFGRAAVAAVRLAAELCLCGRADALVTPPVGKESMHLAGFRYEGQTELLGEICGARRFGMLACNGNLRVLPATRHVALREVVSRLDVATVADALLLAHEAARDLLRLPRPRVVLAGLNPHAGEAGAFGDEEERILRPAIARVRQQRGFETAGPAVPDVVFRAGLEGVWDVVVALYHDQAFIPLKLMGRRGAYTLFVGAPLLRASPMHGTAYDIARSGRADAEPFARAFGAALELAPAARGRTAAG